MKTKIKQKLRNNEYIDWNEISQYQDLSEEFFEEFKDYVNWIQISEYQQLSEDFIREFSGYVIWNLISINQNLSEEFIKEFQDTLNWHWISEYQNLSEEFIKEFQDDVDWHYISQYQQLSEEFIEEFKDYVIWNLISINQQLSEEFIKEFKDRVIWRNISQCQNLSEEFLEEFKDYVDIDLYRCYHIEKPYYQKLEEVIDFCKLYNLYYDNEYFEAYREFGTNNRELNDLNYIQHYIPNTYYTNWRVDNNCNHSYSFGYEVSGIKIDNTYKKIRIKIKDWGTKIKTGNYARVKGFMII